MGKRNKRSGAMDCIKETTSETIEKNIDKCATESQVLPTKLVQNILFQLPLETFGTMVIALGLGSMGFCFVTACLFQYEQVTETECHVQNYVPSISGVTGVAPQRYVHRICIGLQTGRFAVGFIYYNYYMARLDVIAEKHKTLFKRLVSINFWLYTVEIACLLGTAFIANVENYSLHEKIFVVFMISSLLYEFTTIILFRWCHRDPMPDSIASSYKWKRRYFAIIMTCTTGLVYFFIRHRLYCEPHAFSFFAAFEYGIAAANGLFHYTGAKDFKGTYFFLGHPQDDTRRTSNRLKNS